MKSIISYSFLGTLATISLTAAKDPNSLVSKKTGTNSGIIWNDDKTRCLMMKNTFIDKKQKKGRDWEKIWDNISRAKNAKRRQRHIRDGATPRCEDTKVFWSTYCYETLTNNYADNEEKWLDEDPNVEKALFRVSVHEDLDNIFCIIPEGEYCLKEEPGTYKLQSVGTGKKWEKFSFLPFDGRNPDYFFDFDSENGNALVYGSDDFGWEKINVPKDDRRNARMNVGNVLDKVQSKRLDSMVFSDDEDCIHSNMNYTVAFYTPDRIGANSICTPSVRIDFIDDWIEFVSNEAITNEKNARTYTDKIERYNCVENIERVRMKSHCYDGWQGSVDLIIGGLNYQCTAFGNTTDFADGIESRIYWVDADHASPYFQDTPGAAYGWELDLDCFE